MCYLHSRIRIFIGGDFKKFASNSRVFNNVLLFVVKTISFHSKHGRCRIRANCFYDDALDP